MHEDDIVRNIFFSEDVEHEMIFLSFCFIVISISKISLLKIFTVFDHEFHFAIK